jgi:small subunit ribosomal protein S17e
MGRVKPTYIKRSGDRIMEDHPQMVSTDFKENKKLVTEVFDVSKNYRNRLAGYLTRAKRREQE